jgi:hypothetical protein
MTPLQLIYEQIEARIDDGWEDDTIVEWILDNKEDFMSLERSKIGIAYSQGVIDWVDNTFVSTEEYLKKL